MTTTLETNISQFSNLSFDDDDEKNASCISLQSQKYHQEWKELKRTPSNRSAYSQNSGYQSKLSSSIDLSSVPPSFGSRLWQSEMESLLKQMYTSIRHRQIVHPTTKCDTSNEVQGYRRKSINGHRYGAFKRNVGNMMWKAARDSLFLSENNILDYSQPLTPRSTVSSMSSSFPRRRSISYHAVASLLHYPDLPTSYTSAAPYYKEGMIVRKHLLEQANHKARQRDWKECFMVVDRGEIRMYRLESYGQRRKNTAASSRLHPLQNMVSRGSSLATVSESISSCDQSSMTSDTVLGGGDWMAHAQLIGEIDLKHTLSNALPSGYSRQRRHAFALQQANGGVYLFQVGSEEQVMEWVATCNYWAARESKEPLMGGVGNLEYGWGACLQGMDDDEDDKNNDAGTSFTVYQWQPPVPPLMASSLGEMAQLDALVQHIKTLNEELDRHRDLKRKMEQKFCRKTSNQVCAMANFENKTQYLLHEIIKYQNYCDSIEKSLALQDKAIQEQQV
ncbi:Pleckstrin homology domain-containing protein [Halteromyces radiatus]|uniref:Pleckstrin homology domain-containing protein n=1 Tax=Halteromyces radiatus TaxID=101107 RepID=UPI00221F07BB|nr:Pleckstrin homology domain-containing protein [Halteromyces radiatus]KAI8092985.1 Pleckstrin homology domain-containing protein [Halteromyces radiatus]